MSDFKIDTERLLVRRFTPMDGSDFAEMLTDPETVYYEPYEVLTREQAVAEAAMLAHNPAFYAVELKASGKVIGKLYLKNQDFFDSYELGYTFNRNYWGKGYASEAAKALMQYAFTELSARRIIAEADIRNVRSCRLLEKLGFRREGVFIQSAAFQTAPDGTPVFSDYCFYAMLKEEFLKCYPDN